MTIGRPYAIRSSALSERGGTGIYHSTFFVPRGDRDRDLQLLWEKERDVYASELSGNARAWREKSKAPFGMAIFVQPVSGSEVDGCWLPSLSGVAYTSYQGLPTVRLVVGLGTQAVSGCGIVGHESPGLGQDDFLHFQRAVWDLDEADMIELGTGDLGQMRSHSEIIHGQIAEGYEAFCGLFEKLWELKDHGDFSLEWALSGPDLDIVQCAPYEDKLPGDMSIDKSRYFLFVNGTDVFNSGRNVCRAVVYVYHWSPIVASRLENLNRQLAGTNYLLIVPQKATSLLASLERDEKTREVGKRLEFRHFSNAGVVIEKQQHLSEDQKEAMRLMRMNTADHSGGVGASHFQQLCSRSDILFVGATFDPYSLFNLPGEMRYGDPVDISVWSTEAVGLVDGEKKEGYVYLSKEGKSTRYQPEQVQEYSMAMRQAALNLESSGQKKLVSALYSVHYAIGSDEGPVQFDPFSLDEEIVGERGLDGLRQDVQVVISGVGSVSRYVPDIWRSEFRQYLEDLRAHLS
ncbi:MAG: hypothetical protein WCV68_00080 [Candidatus Paceibacterota bacterium]